MPTLIGIGGLKQHGKDEFAKNLGDNWVVIGMAEPLYNQLIIKNFNVDIGPDGKLRRVTDVLADCGNDWVEAKKNPEIRRMLQVEGTEGGRKVFGENVWVDVMVKRVKKHMEAGKNVAVTGIRFPNEAQAIRDNGGDLVWVERLGYVGDADVNSGHASENSVSSEDFDVVVLNDSTLDALREKAQNVSTILSSTES
jgi:hypothetical protein